ncbi:MAG: hypothetical protein AAB403_08160, partial [Planctomycetota bacterium]
GRPRQVAPQLGPTIWITNNVLGFMEKLVMPGDAGPRVTTFVPNELGRVSSVTYPDGLSETSAFDVIGNTTSRVDRAGRKTTFTYLPTRKVSSVTRQLGSSNVTTSVAYDQQFNTLNITDAKGRAVESYALDTLDRVSSVTNLERQAMTFTYAVGGFVSKIIRFDGTTVSNAYGADGLLASTAYPGATNRFAYLKNGLMVLASNATCRATNTWDNANRLSQAKVTNLVSKALYVNYSWDPVGNPTNIISSLGVTNAMTFDIAERLSTATITRRGLAALRYTWGYNTNNGLVGSVVCTNTGVSVSNRFDIIDQITNIVWKNSSTLASFDYLYNTAGMVTQKIAKIGSSVTTNRYSSDGLDRLVS